MSRYYLFQDTRKCIGCKACEIQCKINKGLPIGPRVCQIFETGPEMVGDVPRSAFVFMPCFHCQEAWCVSVCPTGAMQLRSRDGIVFIDQNLCVGCKTCIAACPWGAPQWNPETGKVVKCDYCKDRLDQGLRPACVTVCPTQCLVFSPEESMPQSMRQRCAATMASLQQDALEPWTPANVRAIS